MDRALTTTLIVCIVATIPAYAQPRGASQRDSAASARARIHKREELTFRWIFVINGHGAPTHNIAINQACDFVSETFAVTMLHLTALFRTDERIQALGEKVQTKHFSRADLASFGLDVHAGVGETSGMLAVRPDLVRRTYRTLPTQSGRTLDELRTVASAPDWQGYFSSPAKATLAYGRDVEAWWVEGLPTSSCGP